MLGGMDTHVDADAQQVVAGLVLRQERPDDTRAVALAHLAAFLEGHAGILPEHLLAGFDADEWVRRRRERLADPNPHMQTLVAEVDGTVVGHITFGKDRTEPYRVVGRVWACYLHPAWWGSGIADAMMHAALSTLPHHTVRLWMLEGNNRADGFYQRHGFRPDGARDRYQRPGWESDYPMISYTLHRTLHRQQQPASQTGGRR